MVKCSLAAGLAMCLSWGALGQTAKGVEPAPPSAPATRQLLEQDRYSEALAAAQASLKANPASVDDQAYRIEALMGLDRDMEALRYAVPLAGQHPERPDLRYRVGKCAYKLGMFPQAVQAWAALYACPDKEWAGRAYSESAQTLVLEGKEIEARKLVAEGLNRWSVPPVALLKYSLEINPGVADGIKHADQLIALDPVNKAEYESLRSIFAAAGEGELFQEAPRAGTVSFQLQERFLSKQMPSGVTRTQDRYSAVQITTSYTAEIMWGDLSSDYSEAQFPSAGVAVPVALDGMKERWMLLDSGSDTVLVSKTLAKELALQSVSAISHIGIGHEGVKKRSWVLIKHLAIGDFSMKNVPAVVIEDNDDFWKENGGIIPLSLFSAHGVLYDRRKGMVTLYPSGTKPEEALPGESFSVKSLWDSGEPHVEVKVQERAGLNFLVDTGAGTTSIAGQYAQELGVHVKRGEESKRTKALSGSTLSGQADDVTLWLGPARFKLPPCQVTEVRQGGAKTYGILGRNILDSFAIYFDCRSNIVAFKAYER